MVRHSPGYQRSAGGCVCAMHVVLEGRGSAYAGPCSASFNWWDPPVCSPCMPYMPREPVEAGLLQSSYILVKHPLGGFGESLLRAGEKMEMLTHVEIKVVPGEPVEGRVRGTTWEDSQRIFSTFKSALTATPGPDGLVCEI